MVSSQPLSDERSVSRCWAAVTNYGRSPRATRRCSWVLGSARPTSAEPLDTARSARIVPPCVTTSSFSTGHTATTRSRKRAARAATYAKGLTARRSRLGVDEDAVEDAGDVARQRFQRAAFELTEAALS